MAKEYQRTAGGTLQWRDKSAGVDGWNNIERDEEPASQKQAAPKPAPVSAGGGGGGAPAPAPAPVAPKPAVAAPAAPESMEALNKIAMPTASAPMPMSMAGMAGGSGGGGAAEGPSAGILGQTQGSLRPLGRRMLPQDSMALAGLQRRVY